MKRKILLLLTMAVIFACMLVFTVSAESVHDGKVDLNASVMLDDGTECALFDNEGNALIWYLDSSKSLQSIRADDSRVRYKATYGFNVGNKTVGSAFAYEVSDMWIALDGGNISKGNIVVLNLMDDDVVINEGGSSYLNGPVNCIKNVMWANKVLEYAFVRLDTVALQANAFNGCPKLKYINIEDLTELRQLGGGSALGNCSVLFKDQVIDLTNTKLTTIGGNGTFNYVPVAGIKFPSTLTSVAEWNLQGTGLVSFSFPTGVATITGSQFNDCKSLTTIYINNTTTSISARAFNNTALEKIFFVGTLEQLNALLDNTSAESNAPFLAVVGENRANVISYEKYKALADKSGKYVVYGYSYCEAYNDGEHAFSNDVQMNNSDYFNSITFASSCTVCNENLVIEEMTIAPIFIWKGYSKSTFGETYSVVQGFYIDREALAQYKAYAPDFDFGIMATGNAKGEAIKPQIGDEKVFTAIFDNTVNDYYDVKVTGITQALVDKNIVFCIYVLDGGKMYYLDGEKTAESVSGISYNSIK